MADLMVMLWVIFMLTIFGAIAAWGVRQDDDRRALRELYRFLKVGTDAFQTLTVAFKQLHEPIQKIAKAFEALGKAFKPAFQHEGHIVIIQGDMTEFDPSVFRGTHYRTVSVGEVVELNPEDEIL